MKETRKRSAKVLSFERNAEFHYEMYRKSIERGKYIDSLVALRTAVEKEPDNPEYRLALAELYTELNYFDESSLLLLELLAQGFDGQGDCIFGLGCNFYGLRDFSKAQECFEQYLTQYPDGEYEYEAEDFLDMMEEEEQEEGPDSYLPGDVFARAERGKALLDAGRYEESVAVLREASLLYPDVLFIQNNLALAYFCSGNVEDAIRHTEMVLNRDLFNVHATCNIILFYLSKGRRDKAEAYSDYLKLITPGDVDEKIKVALTYCELEQHEKAYIILKDVLGELPYDLRTIFLAGATAANAGRLREALDYFMTLLRLDPDNTIALYYKIQIQEAMEKETPIEIAYLYQVPAQEMHRRMEYLNSCVKEGIESLRERWKTDQQFQSTLLWGLSISDAGIKHAVLELLGNFQDRRAERALRSFLLKRDESDTLKNDVFLILNHMGAPAPYAAYLAGKFVEARVGAFNREQRLLHESNHRVVDKIIEGAEALEKSSYAAAAIELLDHYISLQEKPPVMKNIEAWAAAALFLSVPTKTSQTQEEICQALGCTQNSLKRCIRLLRSAMKEKGDS